jgi:hypothetical protein
VQKFTDNADREWTITINVPNVDRVLAATKVDLFTIVEGPALLKTLGNIRTLVRVIYTLCQPEAEAKSISPEDFAAAIVGDIIDEAGRALLEDLSNFFQKDQRQPLKAALVKANQASRKASERLLERVEALDLDKLVREAVSIEPPPASVETSIDPLASSALIPES